MNKDLKHFLGVIDLLQERLDRVCRKCEILRTEVKAWRAFSDSKLGETEEADADLNDAIEMTDSSDALKGKL